MSQTGEKVHEVMTQYRDIEDESRRMALDGMDFPAFQKFRKKYPASMREWASLCFSHERLYVIPNLRGVAPF